MGLRGQRDASRGVEEIVEVREFGGELLDAVFAEEALAGGVGFEDGLGGMHFADGHERYVGWRTVGAGAGVGDAVVELLEVSCDGRHGQASVYESWGKILKVMDFRGYVDCGPGVNRGGNRGYWAELHPDDEILRHRSRTILLRIWTGNGYRRTGSEKRASGEQK